MIDERSVEAVTGSRLPNGLVKPLYNSFCFSQIPDIIPALFSGNRDERVERLVGRRSTPYDTVILLLLDGFGWRFFERYGDRYPFLQRFARDGVVTKLTSQFPSTTSAHITTIHTGLEVGQSGMYEWFIYEPSLDAIIAPLPFNFLGDRRPGTLSNSGVQLERLFPLTTLHQRLRRERIATYVYQSREFTPSAFTTLVCAGAELRPFATFADGLRDLVDTAGKQHGSAYHYLYLGDIDAVGHEHGPDSPQFDAITDASLRALESILVQELGGRLRNALLLVTADHGQVTVDPDRTLYVNRRVPALEEWLETGPFGRPITPSGVWRDMFLHIRPSHLREAHEQVTGALDGAAEVSLVDDLVADGYFGSQPPSGAFTRRMGNLCILPDRDHLVWWDAPTYPRPHFLGYHGGLTSEEMETELMSYEL